MEEDRALDSLLRPLPPESPVERIRTWIGASTAMRWVLPVGIVLIVAALVVWRWPSAPPTVNLPYAQSTHPGSTTAPVTTIRHVVVDVAGAVLHPGVVELSDGARVAEAIATAGGVALGADLRSINLAHKLADGDRVYVPLAGESAPPGPPSPSPGESVSDAPINLNTATAAELEELPGIGPSTAAAIVSYREAHGPFQAIDQLGEVRGIGPAKLEALRGAVSL